MSGRLAGKRCVVTGGASGIGEQVVRHYVREGALVIIGDISEAAGRRLAEELGEATRFEFVDVAQENSVASFIEKAASTLKGLDVLAQIAGVQAAGRVTELPSAEWERMFAVNVRSQFFGAKYSVPHLRRSGGGSIINMASVAGKRGGPGMTGYSASKGAVIAFSSALARELAPDNIRVNAVCPGWVDTSFNGPAIANLGGADAQARIVLATVPLGRQASVQEIAPLFVYLASDESMFMTAQSVTIDGGVTS